ncbi:TPA: hypothetical protein HNN80_25190 [Escherichia coli]|nr:hypothetical protein [Escherichia coli]
METDHSFLVSWFLEIREYINENRPETEGEYISVVRKCKMTRKNHTPFSKKNLLSYLNIEQ